jgi:hypothetical protein
VAKEKKKKEKGKEQAAAEPDAVPRLANHPRAKSQIGLAKSWAGLIGFAAVTLLSRGAGVPWFDSLLRGLGAGVVCYLVAWMAAVAIWSHLAKAELEVMRRRTEERIEAERDAARGQADDAGRA